jgi:hypothetical protein
MNQRTCGSIHDEASVAVTGEPVFERGYRDGSSIADEAGSVPEPYWAVCQNLVDPYMQALRAGQRAQSVAQLLAGSDFTRVEVGKLGKFRQAWDVLDIFANAAVNVAGGRYDDDGYSRSAGISSMPARRWQRWSSVQTRLRGMMVAAA